MNIVIISSIIFTIITIEIIYFKICMSATVKEDLLENKAIALIFGFAIGSIFFTIADEIRKLNLTWFSISKYFVVIFLSIFILIAFIAINYSIAKKVFKIKN